MSDMTLITLIDKWTCLPVRKAEKQNPTCLMQCVLLYFHMCEIHTNLLNIWYLCHSVKKTWHLHTESTRPFTVCILICICSLVDFWKLKIYKPKCCSKPSTAPNYQKCSYLITLTSFVNNTLGADLCGPMVAKYPRVFVPASGNGWWILRLILSQLNSKFLNMFFFFFYNCHSRAAVMIKFWQFF